MVSDHAARLIAEAEACAADAARLRALADRIDRRPIADELLAMAVRLEDAAARLRVLAH